MDIDIKLACLGFHNCERLTQGREAEELLALLREAGATFPLKELNPDYDVLPRLERPHSSLLVAHPSIDEDEGMICDVRNGETSSPLWRTARCGLADAPRSVYVTQSASFHIQGSVGVDRTFAGLLRLGETLFPYLVPAYGMLDDLGDPVTTAQDVRSLELKSIGWANFFGPPFVEKLGRDFLHDTPAWRVIDLPGGGVLVQATERFFEWRYDPYFGDAWPYDWDAQGDHPLAKHFRRRYPKLVVFRGNDCQEDTTAE